VAERARALWAEKHPHLLSRTTIVGGSFLEKGAQAVFCFSAASAASKHLLCTMHVAVALPRQLRRAGSVPKAASSRSVYLLRGVLHDWNDDECMKILRHIRAAIGAVPPVHL